MADRGESHGAQAVAEGVVSTGPKYVDAPVAHHFPSADKPSADKPQPPKQLIRYSFWRRLIFADVDAIIAAGFKNAAELTVEESCFREHTVDTIPLITNLEGEWAKQQLLRPEAPDLKRALLRGNVRALVFTGVLYLISQACTLAGPLLLREIVGGLQCTAAQKKVGPARDLGCEPMSKMYFFIIGLFLAPLIQSLTENHQTYQLYLIGTRMRNALMAAIYRKCLRLSVASLQAESTGKVVTLMSNDAQKLQDAMMAIHAMWGSPLYIVAVLVLLWFQVGWATFVGLGVMLFLVPITGMLAAKLGGLRRELMQYTDKRIGLMSELLNGIQMIKFYAWEPSFDGEVMKWRNKEATVLRRQAVWQGLFGMLLFSGPVAVAVFCFGSYTIAGNELTSATAYAALALFSLLRFPMSFLPMLVTMVVNALIAIKRISSFLRRPESILIQEEGTEAAAPGEIFIREGMFAWSAPPVAVSDEAVGKGGDKGMFSVENKGKPAGGRGGKPAVAAAAAEKAAGSNGHVGNGHTAGNGHGNTHVAVNGDNTGPAAKGGVHHLAPPSAPAPITLQGIELSAKPGSLTMIVGSVGSGKSSVLSALLGTIPKMQGQVALGGRIAYVAQSAWIMNDTLQENVLMGEPLDPERYKAALDVSCLGPDLEVLPNGDLTEIGDRGVTLSGGQKQRVSIARAVYSDADVYLLDDPLSAVDSHVSRELFERCIRGVLRHKTILLVTNALQYLPHADNILWLDAGRTRAQGSYNDLVAAGLNIAELAHMDESDESSGDEASSKGVSGGGAEGGQTVCKRVPSQGKDQQTDAARVTAKAKRNQAAKKAAEKHKGMSKAQASKVTLVRQATGDNKNLTGIETRESGAVSWRVVSTYFGNGGGLPIIALLVLLFGLEQAARVWTDKWVGLWFTDKYGRGNWFYLGIYFGMGCAYALTSFVRSITFLFLCVNAAVNTHNQLLRHIMHLPKLFFDTNPTGRVLNRFSRDTDIMDSVLPASLIQFAGCLTTYVSIMVVIAIATKWFAVALGPLTIIYLLIQRYYIPSARELQRMESISRSPIYSKFSEALAGITTIRAYRKEGHFTSVSDELMELNAYAFVTQKLASGWLAMRLDMIGLSVLTICGALVIQGNIDPATAGLALVYALDLTRFLKHGTNMASKSEADFNSVERIVQYLGPEVEAPPDTEPHVLATMPPNWPAHGALAFEDVQMRYRVNLPLVLKGVSFTIQGGEKVGLVGRTGSGKSSLFLALFRMVEAESGRIVIDGVDTRTLGVRHLRSVMSIIPQDPFMFSGTVRKNLDPFVKSDDAELWTSLEAVGLKPAIQALDLKLDAQVVDNGGNFSLGQRQLLCLARAMLRRSRLLMLDEATASVDLDTDSALQTAIRMRFADCTMLTIAHRLNTIMDSDKVVVMDQGVVVECDDPDALLQQAQGSFTSMVDQTGKSSSRYLKSMARTARETRTSMLRGAHIMGAQPRLVLSPSMYLQQQSGNLTTEDERDDSASASSPGDGSSTPTTVITMAGPATGFAPVQVGTQNKFFGGATEGKDNMLGGANGLRAKSMLGSNVSFAAGTSGGGATVANAVAAVAASAHQSRLAQSSGPAGAGEAAMASVPLGGVESPVAGSGRTNASDVVVLVSPADVQLGGLPPAQPGAAQQ